MHRGVSLGEKVCVCVNVRDRENIWREGEKVSRHLYSVRKFVLFV